MDKLTAQQSIKQLYSEAFALNPSALIQLFEIDISQIGFNRGVISQNEITSQNNTIFRFHNNVKLTHSSIFWQNNEYVAAPIMAEDFEIKGRGTLPTPKLSLTVSDDGIPTLSRLKDRILQLGDLVGAKVTRIRTFAKFLDATNFYGGNVPNGYFPNPNAEFPRDVFYIDSKSKEDKSSIVFELGSVLDVQGQKLPGRLVVCNTCPFNYRGHGCMYEYNSRRIVDEHGETWESSLLSAAPPVANEFNEVFSTLLSGITLIDKGAYSYDKLYNSGDYVYVTHNNINYYFVGNGVNISASPPNKQYWIADQCSKNIRGCELRYALGGSAAGTTLGNLPYGGFLSVTRFK